MMNIREGRGDKAFLVIIYAAMGLMSVLCIIPVIHVISQSLSSSRAILSGEVFLWPVEINLDAYRMVFMQSRVPQAFVNSIVITAGGTLSQILFTTLAAYPLSRSYFIGRKFFSMAFVFTMMFGAGTIPNYMLVNALGLTNTYWSLWLPGLVSVYNTMVLRTHFESLPQEIEESARIDGAGEWRILLRMYLPLSKATFAALTLFAIVGGWNMFRSVLLYIRDSSKHNLAVYVQNLISQQRALQELNSNVGVMDIGLDVVEKSIQAAAIVVLLLPIFAIYPFLQKHFAKGVMIGAIKG